MPGKFTLYTQALIYENLRVYNYPAYDINILGIRPYYTVEIRGDILKEEDGPMLKHGLQGMHGQKIVLPGRAHQYPDRELLEMRYGKFRKVV